ncbi:MAG: hypothetical protein H6824_24225 [Planctomycetaceae bacterium]|nr:hypothetical protein [Planctomycetaceae bacterium]
MKESRKQQGDLLKFSLGEGKFTWSKRSLYLKPLLKAAGDVIGRLMLWEEGIS